MLMEQYRTPLIYGLFGAILGFVFYLMLLFSGNSPWSSASWMGCWIPGVTALFSIKKIQTINPGLNFPFSEVFKIALITIVAQAMIFNLIALIFGLFFGANAIQMYQQEFIEYAEQIKTLIGDEKYVQLQEELQKTTLVSLTFGDFMNKIIGGIIVSLILAGILKNNKPSFKNNE
jgi:hypothetical protein